MQTDNRFHDRVEVLAYRHARDWRIAKSHYSSQDLWLVAQQHVRRMGVRHDLIQPGNFVDRVRMEAHRIHGQRPHICDGPLVDWNLAWLQRLTAGEHLEFPEYWNERDRNRLCSVVYFVQAKEARFNIAELIYKLQMGLLHIPAELVPRSLLFQPLNLRDQDFEREVRYSSQQFPRIFVVDADELQRRYRLHEVLSMLNRYGIPWQCDADFISYCLRDATNFRSPQVSLEANWANHAGWEWRDIAYNLVCDILAI